MKEINLLPKWYKCRRRRQIIWRMQYVALGLVFLAVMAWNFWAVHHISKISSELERLEPKIANAETVSMEFSKIKNEIAELQTKANTIDVINSKIDVGSVLAEISFLISERIVISEVDFKAVKLPKGRIIQQDAEANLKTALSNTVINGTARPKGTGGARFKVTIT